ncbi:helix-turn-helix domain-containing protein [Stappia sp. BW2]|uniref:helix-turn-helix domain-containing protein n=1 Tax=Stappia sp. BW2 TaxID=2592622 RepID=UPI0011DE74CF|nr:helix-turn-helix domain-containing protein [Stappia sp. BW2]TYC64742.1 helix-turn-helix domain-containing protein [Stappia sp. BW2]
MTVELETVNELSSRTGWPKSRIRKLVENRELRHVRIGGGIYIPTGAIEEFISNNTIAPIVEKKSSTSPEV